MRADVFGKAVKVSGLEGGWHGQVTPKAQEYILGVAAFVAARDAVGRIDDIVRESGVSRELIDRYRDNMARMCARGGCVATRRLPRWDGRTLADVADELVGQIGGKRPEASLAREIARVRRDWGRLVRDHRGLGAFPVLAGAALQVENAMKEIEGAAREGVGTRLDVRG